jgi:hypothetical protein
MAFTIAERIANPPIQIKVSDILKSFLERSDHLAETL